MRLAGWMNRHQQDVTMYLKEENEILREKLGRGIPQIRVSLVQAWDTRPACPRRGGRNEWE